MRLDLGKVDLFRRAYCVGKRELAGAVNTCNDVFFYASHGKEMRVNVAGGVAFEFVIGGGPKHNVGRGKLVSFYGRAVEAVVSHLNDVSFEKIAVERLDLAAGFYVLRFYLNKKYKASLAKVTPVDDNGANGASEPTDKADADSGEDSDSSENGEN